MSGERVSDFVFRFPLSAFRSPLASLRPDAFHRIAACHGEGAPADGEEGYEQGDEHGDNEQPPGEVYAVGEEFQIHLRTLDGNGEGQHGGQEGEQDEGACQLPRGTSHRCTHHLAQGYLLALLLCVTDGHGKEAKGGNQHPLYQ